MEGLHEWHEFYILLGTAAAALVALLFVAVSIGVGVLTHQGAAATRTYMSPVVVHFAAILFVSLLMLAPANPEWLVPALIVFAAIVGICISIFVTARVARDRYEEVVFTDALAYGALPVIGYAAMLCAAVIRWRYSADLLAGGLLVLLLSNIRNAWDLMLTMVRRHSRSARS
jgi:hypothetical protein